MSDLEMRFQRDAALLQQARSLQMNPGYLVMFGISALFICLAVLIVGISGFAGWIIVGTTLGVGALGVVTGKSNLIMAGGITILGAVAGVVSILAMVFTMLGITGGGH